MQIQGKLEGMIKESSIEVLAGMQTRLVRVSNTLGVTIRTSKSVKRGGSFEPNEPPLDPPLDATLLSGIYSRKTHQRNGRCSRHVFIGGNTHACFPWKNGRPNVWPSNGGSARSQKRKGFRENPTNFLTFVSR